MRAHAMFDQSGGCIISETTEEVITEFITQIQKSLYSERNSIWQYIVEKSQA